MLLIYSKNPLRIGHTVTAYSDDYLAFITDHPELGYIETQEVHISPATHDLIEDNGVVSLRAKPDMAIAMPTTAKVGQLFEISGVPEGAMIVSDNLSGFMDASGVLELSFDHPGAYTVFISHSAYKPMEASVEVTA